ncbi:hypothetical protein LCGC14_1435130 [marine sediment metagenome]|uniref:ATP-cone domain-containing protein n=1 Tax=marine sediment metagenome TaxID=412755 RepID=A0A0F9K8L8_9ZZZZ
MKCPFCGHIEDKVIDSRAGKDNEVIRRRRECLGCERRFTSYERVDEVMPMVIKKDNRREPFDREKILRGLNTALKKRPVDVETREMVVGKIERLIIAAGQKEIPSSRIGEELMNCLRDVDKVAFVRFASVYREFEDVTEFMDELRTLLRAK